jgi:hypothetical protein
MEFPMTIDSLQDLYKATWSDPSFKAEFLQAPKTTLAKVGVEIAKDVELTVLEESDKDVYFVIPTPEVASDIHPEGDLIAELIKRAATDLSLRQEMLADPKAVILRETGLVIPDDANVAVFEQTADHAYFVLPRPAQAEEGDRELSADELETVAAGGWFIPVIKFTIKFCPIIYRTIMNGVRGCLG